MRPARQFTTPVVHDDYPRPLGAAQPHRFSQTAEAKPLPVARAHSPYPVLDEARRLGAHDLIATEDTVCGLCGQRIAKDEVVTLVRHREDEADKVVHPDCMASDLAKRFSILSAFGKRGARALR